MQGKVLVFCDKDGKELKEPVSRKNIDLDFKSSDRNFGSIRVLRISQGGTIIHLMIILEEEIDDSGNFLFSGLEFIDMTNSYDKEFRKYHYQQIIFTPY